MHGEFHVYSDTTLSHIISHITLPFILILELTVTYYIQASDQTAVVKKKKKSKKSKKSKKGKKHDKEQQQEEQDPAKSTVDVKKEEEKRQPKSDLIDTENNSANKGVRMNEEIEKVISDKSKEAHVRVVDTAQTSSTSGNANNAAASGAPSGVADAGLSEKEKMQQKLKEVS